MNKLIEKLQQTGNVLKRKYEAEKQRMKELHALQRQVEAKVSEQADYKQTKGGLDACTMQDLKAQKKCGRKTKWRRLFRGIFSRTYVMHHWSISF